MEHSHLKVGWNGDLKLFPIIDFGCNERLPP